MTQDIFKFLKKYSSDTRTVNRLIVSSFLIINGIKTTKNKEIKRYIIESSDTGEYDSLVDFNQLILKNDNIFSLEHLIELFEFVVSPSDKIINGAIYTPQYIRRYIVDNVLKNKFKSSEVLTCADLSCGCGGFLLTASQWLKSKTNKTYFEIYRDFVFGLDITAYSIERSILLLILNALQSKEDVSEFKFNLKVGNALDFDRTQYKKEVTNGFDVILGNPPYVCSRNMDGDSKSLLKKWSVTESGHPDLYIPFFQIGLENLKAFGVLAYITVNTFTKSINGRALRHYFSNRQSKIKIINFGGEQIFRGRNTYTCICFIENSDGNIEYVLTSSQSITSLKSTDFKEYLYTDLNHSDGWNLTNSESTNSFIKKIEATGTQFKDKYTTRNGIATLRNDVYKFFPEKRKDPKYYYFTKGDQTFKVEKNICRDIINSNKIKDEEDIRLIREKIIFPYVQNNDRVTVLSESALKRSYPNTYKYLETNRKILSKRDKGEREYDTWFAYGRKQSMDINAYKLFFPHICEKPSFTLCRDKDLLFYNGLAVISDSYTELQLLKKILESELFLKYITSTTKNYASGYFSLSKNYLKNFGIYNFNNEQKKQLLAMNSSDEIDSFLINLYETESIDQKVLIDA